MQRKILILLALALLPAAGAGTLVTYQPSSGSLDPVEVDVPWGQRQDATTIGTNNSTATVTIAGTLSLSTDDVLYANNTNPDSDLYLRLALTDTTGLDLIELLKIGIDNGTQVEQIVIDTTGVLQETGTLVHIPPGSTNTIYVEQNLDSLLSTVEVTFDMIIADDNDESAYATTNATIVID